MAQLGRVIAVLALVCALQSEFVASVEGHRHQEAGGGEFNFNHAARIRSRQRASMVSSVPLHNAAVPGLMMPVVGIGTGGYALSASQPGEIWNDTTAEKAVFEWIQLGGRRVDASYSYLDQVGVGKAIQKAISQGIVTREELFIVSKVGNEGHAGGAAMGYNDTLVQIDPILTSLQLKYVDLLLIHWPGPPGKSKDPNCQPGQSSYKACRQATWRALEYMFRKGQTKAIGVANYEQNHVQDVIDMGGLLPAINQVEFHPYWHELDLVAFCQNLNITFNGYSPMSCPDYAPPTHNWTRSALQEPVVVKIASDHGVDPSQVLLAWELSYGVIVNPRTRDPKHMALNLEFEKVKLSAAEIASIAAIVPPKHNKVCPDPHQFK